MCVFFGMNTKISILCILAMVAGASPAVEAPAPIGPTSTKVVKLDGVALSSQPSSGRVLAPTFQYDAATRTLHMWVLMAGAPDESLTKIRHAVSTDGLNFVSTGNMSYAG
jgi:hypothetical protein